MDTAKTDPTVKLVEMIGTTFQITQMLANAVCALTMVVAKLREDTAKAISTLDTTQLQR